MIVCDDMDAAMREYAAMKALAEEAAANGDTWAPTVLVLIGALEKTAKQAVAWRDERDAARNALCPQCYVRGLASRRPV